MSIPISRTGMADGARTALPLAVGVGVFAAALGMRGGCAERLGAATAICFMVVRCMLLASITGATVVVALARMS